MRILPWALVMVLAAAAFCAPARTQDGAAPRLLAGWNNASTPDGWTGKRYVDGGEVFAEEFDSNGDGRIDVWRFYSRGLLTSEERDLNHDGRVDYQSRWDASRRRLTAMYRDTYFRGSNDLEIEATSQRSWEIREDRNHDGITDRMLIVDGPPELFDVMGVDLYRQQNIVDAIPREYWYELLTDDGFTGDITVYRRFTKGKLSHYGTWDGTKIVWKRAAPGSEPPPAGRPAAPPPPPRYAAASGDVHGPNCPIPNCPQPICRVEDSNAPIRDLPVPTYTEGQIGGPYVQPYAQPGVAPAPFPAETARTRYQGLPPGESAARSLPARMRPPGVGNR